ncbi:HAMP domain-containing histidine kinase [Aquibacillus koreensis]|uniref:histidine kinase n=1 Tax=Aquibacillus koreensis TaxID=279446 RepID=A0A9X3WRU0_9BACI|nr:HAMP domain-containing sensor histidine kinase [Aquibacillus koreensis]MCT2534927.1 HAMP domain-containing histidine kinase [Aquibacillus koreensis]MDC3422179.1 HAMP domain-containing histidine kinase [Aquibacillus koreensis]
MKLQYQLTAAFTGLLIVIMSIAAITIYSLILNLLVQDEQLELEAKGNLLVSLLSDISYENINRINQLIQGQEIQLFLYDRNTDQIVLTNLPRPLVEFWIDNYDISTNREQIWKGANESFVVSRVESYSELSNRELILVTPLEDLQAVQQTFFNRLLIVFVIGIMVAVLLSYLLTKRLVTPLTNLKYQLKKIERRKFDEVEEIKATGEIKEVEQSVLEMANELSRYIQSQRQFFQNASHELKTPLMTIQGYAEGIRDGVFEKEESDRGLDVIVAEIVRLKKIINEMILLAKLDSEENIYQEELIKVDELIKLTVDRALPLANEKQISLQYEVADDLFFYVDNEKMLRAMMNIVTNAIRHASSIVFISVKEINGTINIAIEDDGNGVPVSLMPHLFHRFVKGDGGETGLGLAISRAIVERSGGTISVGESAYGGALFTIKI